MHILGISDDTLRVALYADNCRLLAKVLGEASPTGELDALAGLFHLGAELLDAQDDIFLLTQDAPDAPAPTPDKEASHEG